MIGRNMLSLQKRLEAVETILLGSMGDCYRNMPARWWARFIHLSSQYPLTRDSNQLDEYKAAIFDQLGDELRYERDTWIEHVEQDLKDNNVTSRTLELARLLAERNLDLP